jgi:hypothetical protein
MKRFLVAVALFALIAIVLASAADWAVSAGLHKARNGNYSEWNDIRDGAAAADVIVQGSSRAWTSFSPAIISATTGLSCYNLGIDGYPVGMQMARYQMFREYNSKPEVIIQSLDIYGFGVPGKIYQPVQFLPYLDDPFLRAELAQYHYFAWFDHLLPLVRYRGDQETVFHGGLQLLGLRSYTSAKVDGYQGQDAKWDPAPLDDFIAKHPDGIAYTISAAPRQAFADFLRRCHEEGVFVVLVYPPEYIQAQVLTTNRAEIMSVYETMAGEYGFPLLDYSGDPICLDTRYFYNSQHVNKRGAEKFSAEFAADLQRLLLQRATGGAAGPPA